MDALVDILMFLPSLGEILGFIIKLVIFIFVIKWSADYLAKRTAEEVKEALLDIQVGIPEPEE